VLKPHILAETLELFYLTPIDKDDHFSVFCFPNIEWLDHFTAGTASDFERISGCKFTKSMVHFALSSTPYHAVGECPAFF
jgi:hypothetical protein